MKAYEYHMKLSLSLVPCLALPPVSLSKRHSRVCRTEKEHAKKLPPASLESLCIPPQSPEPKPVGFRIRGSARSATTRSCLQQMRTERIRFWEDSFGIVGTCPYKG